MFEYLEKEYVHNNKKYTLFSASLCSGNKRKIYVQNKNNRAITYDLDKIFAATGLKMEELNSILDEFNTLKNMVRNNRIIIDNSVSNKIIDKISAKCKNDVTIGTSFYVMHYFDFTINHKPINLKEAFALHEIDVVNYIYDLFLHHNLNKPELCDIENDIAFLSKDELEKFVELSEDFFDFSDDYIILHELEG